jgi:hypothetical protein
MIKNQARLFVACAIIYGVVHVMIFDIFIYQGSIDIMR